MPEIKLRLATEITPIWQATETELQEIGIPPPFWAFCWPGGQALARYVLDNPDIVRGKRVLEFAAGGAVSGIAAAMAGAAQVIANDIDAMAVAAAQTNAALNGVTLIPSTENLPDAGHRPAAATSSSPATSSTNNPRRWRSKLSCGEKPPPAHSC